MPNPIQAALQAIRNLAAGRAAAASAAAAAVAPVQMTLGRPVTTKTPQLVVAGMAPGSYTFAVFVTDELGAVSATASCVVVIR